MKNLNEAFKQKVSFVKPLYRKIRSDNRVKPTKNIFVSVDVNDRSKLDGQGICLKKGRVRSNNDYRVIAIEANKNKESVLPGACDRVEYKTYTDFQSVGTRIDHLRREKHVMRLSDRNMTEKPDNSSDKSVQAVERLGIVQKIPDTWLRVYPAPQTADESWLLVILRCAVCQLGLAAFLILWTLTWVFVIQIFEGPFESEVSIQFEKAQNQLVIDLATELRQITPLSPKWKNAIEKRIEDERQLTMAAMVRGAKLHPGKFWDLSGTFLFNVYVMTALGFGAPVPHTTWGRTYALIYAALAVPTHIYLMVNASTCLAANLESKLDKSRCCYLPRKATNLRNLGTTDSGDCSRKNSELNILANSTVKRRKWMRISNVLSTGRYVPIATVCYYTLGAISFGLLRDRAPLEIVMFPLEFTTTGGLEHVTSYVRILYGFYVEGAMALLAYALATLRRHSGSTMIYLSNKHRLFTTES